MSIKLYKDAATAKRAKETKTFSGSTPMQAHIEPGMERMTLQQIAARLQKHPQFKGVIGITLISVNFAVIVEPETMKSL